MADNTTDMTLGVYRRIYAGFRRGRRICSVSFGAEAWFWRLMVGADDFGNLQAEPHLYESEARGRRFDITDEQAEAWFQELLAANLIAVYYVKCERYAHIVGFEELQGNPRNGKRVRKVPHASGGVQIDPDASRLIQCYHHHHQDHDQNHSQNQDAQENGLSFVCVDGGGGWKGILLAAQVPASLRVMAEANPDLMDKLDVAGQWRRVNTDPSIRKPVPTFHGWLRKMLDSTPKRSMSINGEAAKLTASIEQMRKQRGIV